MFMGGNNVITYMGTRREITLISVCNEVRSAFEILIQPVPNMNRTVNNNGAYQTALTGRLICAALLLHDAS